MKEVEELKEILKNYDEHKKNAYISIKNNLLSNISIDKLEIKMFHHDKNIVKFKKFLNFDDQDKSQIINEYLKKSIELEDYEFSQKIIDYFKLNNINLKIKPKGLDKETLGLINDVRKFL